MPRTLNWKAAIVAGLVAGAVFMMLQMALAAIIAGESPWAPPRLIAAMALGRGVLPPPAPFDAGVLMTAMMIHFPLSIVLGAVLGWVIARTGMGAGAAIAAGTVFGLAVYFINFHAMSAVFPWFASARGGIALFSHAMFGLVLGVTYHALAGSPAHARPEARG